MLKFALKITEEEGKSSNRGSWAVKFALKVTEEEGKSLRKKFGTRINLIETE